MWNSKKLGPSCWVVTMVWLLGALPYLLVVQAVMKTDQRESSTQLTAAFLSKPTVSKGTDTNGFSNPFRNGITLKLKSKRTFVVGEDLSAQLYQKLCPQTHGIAKIQGLCSWYGECGKNSLTLFHKCDNTSNVNSTTKSGHIKCDKMTALCGKHIDHDVMIIHKLLFRSNDLQLLGSGIKHTILLLNVTNSSNDAAITTQKVDTNSTILFDSPSNFMKGQRLFRKSTFNTTLTWNSSVSCTNVGNSMGNLLFSYPLGSCRQFVECVGPVPYVRQCPSGYMFHPTFMICDKEETVPPCSHTKNETASNYNSPKKRNSDKVATQRRVIKRETLSLPRVREMRKRPCSVESGNHYIQPHSQYCNKFEICSNGKIHEQACGLGALFNPLSLVCDLPYNVDCESRRIDFSTYDCQPGDHYKTSHPEKCNEFIECDKGTLYIKSCPPSTAYHFEDEECVHIYKAKCKKPISLEHDTDVNYNNPKYQQQSSSRIKSKRSLNFQCTFNYIAPHPEFCNKFIECEDGRIFIKDCGPGTAYNPRLGQCDWPFNVKQSIPEDCSRYRQCHRGRYIEKVCGESTIYDPDKEKCVFPTGKDYDMECKRQQFVTPPPS